MDITLTFNDVHAEQLKKSAESRSLSLEEYVKFCVINEDERFKTKQRGRSPGRPAGGARIREISERLRGIYKTLKNQWVGHEAEYEEIFAPQIVEFEKFVETKDLEGLEEFFAKKPWVLQ